MYNFVFVILHYLAVDDTIACVKSLLLNINYENVNIVVVDNGSNDGSYDILKEEFKSINNIHVLKSDINLGFAKGNNIGFKYAKYNLNADFIAMINNDTIINQNEFCELAIKKYEKFKYYVLGPNIETKDGNHQNPVLNVKWNVLKIYINIIKKIILLILLYINFDFFSSFRKSEKNYNKNHIEKDMFDVTLHGACLIFSKEFIKKFEGLYDKTFLYLEEDILRQQSIYYSYLMMYSNDIKILHNEDASTNLVFKTSKEKEMNKIKMMIKSLTIFSFYENKLFIKKLIGKI